ncbi:hypothetical protein FOL47_002131 [Perkinsus chesapeaki]|uniref:polynucleotide adenylyltransferase n=1 Tax=Perkinsus chesapeaki TaxID=330153 RepID=A0A7J6MF42_PERCH|nr:hypothetical protein FOL47_002131 [Perkinsus chesapeaki]
MATSLSSSSSQSPQPSAALPPWPGVTPPVSENYPTRADYEATEELKHFIESRAPPESTHGMLKRYEVLVEIERMVNKWIYDVSGGEIRSKARVLTFGSFRLGVITPLSDIDTLVLLPNLISRDDFFTDFVETMLNRSPHVTECNPVPAAHVPIIKVKYRGICMDILAACVPPYVLSGDVDSVQEDLIYQVEKRCMKSMNGIRVADKMLSLVVDTQTFRLATRVIKYWAQQRLIYSNAIGYMGGVSWAVMVVVSGVGRVCQLYPNYSAKQIVERFFFVYARWQWTATRDYGNSAAVTLCPIEEAANKVPPEIAAEQGLRKFKEWNPNKYSSDRHHVMPVITPIFPTHNTTYNVQESNKRVIVREIKRGREIMELMSMSKSSSSGGAATKGNEVTWADLCAPFPFFQVYRQFLILEISAETEKAFLKFKGLVESRVRVLVKNLETCCGNKVLPQPHPILFQRGPLGADVTPGEAPAFLGAFVLGIAFDNIATDDAAAAAKVSKEMKSACDAFAEHISQAALSDEWDAYRGQFNLTIQHRYLADLPDYIRPKPAAAASARHHTLGLKSATSKGGAGSTPSAGVTTTGVAGTVSRHLVGLRMKPLFEYIWLIGYFSTACPLILLNKHLLTEQDVPTAVVLIQNTFTILLSVVLVQVQSTCHFTFDSPVAFSVAQFTTYILPALVWSISLTVGMRLVQGFTIPTYIMTRFAASSLVAIGDWYLFGVRLSYRQTACLLFLMILSIAQFSNEARTTEWSWSYKQYLLLAASSVVFVADSLLSKRAVLRLREHHQQSTLGINIIQNTLSMPILIMLVIIGNEIGPIVALLSSAFELVPEALYWTWKALLSCGLCFGMSATTIMMNSNLTAARVSMMINFNKVLVVLASMILQQLDSSMAPSSHMSDLLIVALAAISGVVRTKSSSSKRSRKSVHNSKSINHHGTLRQSHQACGHILSAADEYYRAGYQQHAQRFAQICIDTCRDCLSSEQGNVGPLLETEFRAWLLLCMSLSRTGHHALAVSKGLVCGDYIEGLLADGDSQEGALCSMIRDLWEEDRYEVPTKDRHHRRAESRVQSLLDKRKTERLELGSCTRHLTSSSATTFGSTNVTLLGTLWQLLGTEMKHCNGRPFKLGDKLARELVYSGWELISAVSGEDNKDERQAHANLCNFLEQESIIPYERSIGPVRKSRSSSRTRTASTVAPPSTTASGLYSRHSTEKLGSRAGRFRYRPGTDLTGQRPTTVLTGPRPSTNVVRSTTRLPRDESRDDNSSMGVHHASACDTMLAITINRALIRRNEESLRGALKFVQDHGREGRFQLMVNLMRTELQTIEREEEIARIREYLAGIGDDVDMFELVEAIEGLPRTLWTSPEHTSLLQRLYKCIEERLQKVTASQNPDEIHGALTEMSQVLPKSVRSSPNVISAISRAEEIFSNLTSRKKSDRPSLRYVMSRTPSQVHQDDDNSSNEEDPNSNTGDERPNTEVYTEEILPVARMEKLGPVDGVRLALMYRIGSLTKAYYYFCDDMKKFKTMSPFKFRRVLEQELLIPWETCAGHSDFRLFFDEFEQEKNGEIGPMGLIGFVPPEEHDSPDIEWKRYLHNKALSNERCASMVLNERRPARWDNKEEFFHIMNDLENRPATQETMLHDFWRNQDNLLSWKERKTDMAREFRSRRLASKKQPRRSGRLPPLSEKMSRDLVRKAMNATNEKTAEEERVLRLEGCIKDLYRSRKELVEVTKKLKSELEPADTGQFRNFLLGPSEDGADGMNSPQGMGFLSCLSTAFSKSQA